MKEEFLSVVNSLYRRARKRSYVASYVLGLLRGAPVVFARRKAFTEYFHRVLISRPRARTSTRAHSSAMLASARSFRAAVTVSPFASQTSSDRVPVASVGSVGFAKRRRPGLLPRRPSRLGSASDADLSPKGSAASLSSVVDRLRAAAGTANGTDLDSSGEAKVKLIIQELCARDDSLPNPAAIDLANTNWDLVYSDSSGNSSGKLGPFVGKVEQRFKDEPLSGKYENIVKLGPLTLSLAAVAEPLEKSKKNESLRVTFVDLTVSAFGRQVLTKPFPPGRAGTWRMAYASEKVRVLYTNQGNVFVLTRSANE